MTTLPLTVSFEDDFVGYNLRSEWSAVAPTSGIRLSGSGGIASLVPSLEMSSRLRLGEDGNQPGARAVQNWLAAKAPALEFIFYLNTLDGQATLGFVGEDDGNVPAADFALLYRGPGDPAAGWALQCCAGGVASDWLLPFVHEPGTWTYLRIELSPSVGRVFLGNLYGGDLDAPLFTSPPGLLLPTVPLFVEIQAWATPTNPSDMELNLDLVRVSQGR